MKMGVKITISIIASLLAVILIFLGVYYLWPWNRNFFNNADKEFSIPGLDTKFCPQGMTTFDDDPNKYLISGYMTDGSPSRFYLIDGDTNSIIKYVTLNIDGLDFCGHVGGVTSHGDNIWTVCTVDGAGYGFRFTLSDLNKTTPGGEINITQNADVFNTYNGADFVFVYDNYLWVGEFYKAKKYETPKRHRLVTPSGETNTAVVMGFQLASSDSYSYGLATSSSYNWKPIPQKALSIRGLCQGIAVTSDGKFVLSTSWSLADSHIYLYENVFDEEPAKLEFGAFEGSQAIDLWYLDNDSLINSIKAPSMSEEIIVKNNRVYVLFESACKKYRAYNRKRLRNVYSLSLNYLENEKNS